MMDAQIKNKKESNFIQRFKGKTNVLPKEGIQAMLSRQLQQKADFNTERSKIKSSNIIEDPQNHNNLRYQVAKRTNTKTSSMDLKSKQLVSHQNPKNDQNIKKSKANSHRGSLNLQNTPIQLPRIDKAQSKHGLSRKTQNNNVEKPKMPELPNKRASSESDFKKVISLDRDTRMQLQILNMIEKRFIQMKSKGEINPQFLFQTAKKRN